MVGNRARSGWKYKDRKSSPISPPGLRDVYSWGCIVWTPGPRYKMLKFKHIHKPWCRSHIIFHVSLLRSSESQGSDSILCSESRFPITALPDESFRLLFRWQFPKKSDGSLSLSYILTVLEMSDTSKPYSSMSWIIHANNTHIIFVLFKYKDNLITEDKFKFLLPPLPSSSLSLSLSLSLLLLFLLLLCVCVFGGWLWAQIWRSEDNIWASVLFFHCRIWRLNLGCQTCIESGFANPSHWPGLFISICGSETHNRSLVIKPWDSFSCARLVFVFCNSFMVFQGSESSRETSIGLHSDLYFSLIWR